MTITYRIDSLGLLENEPVFRYSFVAVDFPFAPNQALEIEFGAAQYGLLSNATAPAGFDLLLIQPDNPPGLPGLYSVLALTGAAAPLEGFSVAFSFLGPGLPGGLPFSINQFDSQGSFVSTIASGVTVPVGPAQQIPEPGSLMLAGAGLLVTFAGLLLRRRSQLLT